MTTVTVSNGVTYTVSAGLTDTSDDILAGGTENVFGSSLSPFVNLGGTLDVFRGGVISNAEVNGVLTVQSGGTATNTYINSGTSTDDGSFISGGVESGSTLNVFSGYASYVSVEGVLNDSEAQIYNATVYGGSILCDGGATTSGVLENTTLRQATEDVQQGATAYATVVSSGSRETVYQGGFSSGSIISAGGTQIVNGTVSGAIVSGGVQDVYSGGYAFGGAVYAVQVVEGAGAIDSATLIGDGGVQTVSSGGRAYGAVVSNSGEQDVVSGGRAYGTVLVNGGYQQTFAGAIVSNTVISNGGIEFVNVASVYGSIIKSGGDVQVTNGGRTSNSVISRGGLETVGNSGAAYSTQVTGISATQIMQSGGVAFDTTVSGLDTQEQVQSGGLSYYGTVDSGGQEQVFSGGQAIDVSILASGGETIHGGGLDVSAVVSGGKQIILSGGLAEGGTVAGLGGAQTISTGGSATAATVNSGAVQTIRAGGTASGTTVNASATEYVYGNASGSLLSGGGEIVFSGGVATTGTAHSGSIVTVSSGGKTVSQGVGSAGAEIVVSGGAANATMIYSAGVLTVASGGIISSGITISSGGKAIIGGTMASGQSVKLAANGTDLVLNGGASFGANISGFAGTDKIDLTGFTYNSAAETFNYVESAGNTSGTLTVSSGGSTEKLNFLGNFVTSNFALGNDGSGGTNILDPKVPPVITAPAAASIVANSATAIAGVAISEPGSGEHETFKVTLQDGNGLLAASGKGLTGDGTTRLTVSGTLVQVNTVLATLQDTGGSSDTITITGKDSRGESAAPETIAITVGAPERPAFIAAAPTAPAPAGAVVTLEDLFRARISPAAIHASLPATAEMIHHAPGVGYTVTSSTLGQAGHALIAFHT